jgi:putative sterol carrier protein
MTELTVREIILGQEAAFLPEKAVGVNAVIQYKLSGEEGGNWITTIKDGKCTVAEGIAEKPNLSISANAKDFRDVLTGKLDGMMAFMQGKLRVTGDLNLGQRLLGMFRR